MLSITDLRGHDVDPATVLPRAELDVAGAVPRVLPNAVSFACLFP